MVNTDKLEQKIKESGYRKQYIAEQLGISIQALRMKITNVSEFLCSEATVLMKLLKLTPEETIEIFFTRYVDKTTTSDVTLRATFRNIS